jgi:ADP-ribose pyrophosphatase YjhB (NUDIX family)
MNQRIGARGILIDSDQRILLALERVMATDEEFWVPPGGGFDAQDTSLVDCLAREYLEETGLTINVGPLLYVREFSEPSRDTHHVGLYFLVQILHGELHETNASSPPQGDDLKRHVRWFAQEELRAIRVYPEELRDEFWRQYVASTPQARYLGVAHEDASKPSTSMP